MIHSYVWELARVLKGRVAAYHEQEKHPQPLDSCILCRIAFSNIEEGAKTEENRRIAADIINGRA